MNKIINGRRYDTQTATYICIAVYSGNKYVTLYQKKNGEFFEHHEFNGREWIEPVDESDAKRFAEEQMTGDGYEKVFGKVDE